MGAKSGKFDSIAPVDLAEVDCVGLHQLLENHTKIPQSIRG